MDNNSLAAITSIITFLGIVAEGVRRYFGDKWKAELDAKNRELDRQDRIDKANEIAEHLRLETARLEASGRARTEKVMDKIQENTDVSVKAFTEANNVNEKLVKLHEAIQSSPTQNIVVVNKPSE